MAKRRKKRPSKYPWFAKYIFAAARKAWRWSPEKKKALLAASWNGAKEYFICRSCPEGNWTHKDNIQVDHIKPAVDPVKGFTTWDDYFSRLFCSADNLAVLCINCHKAKTKREGALRKKSRKEQSDL